MKTILILDTETTGTDPQKDRIIEVGYVLWSVQYRTMLEVYSGLLPSPDNAAEKINAIPTEALRNDALCVPWDTLEHASNRADAVVAHNAAFDKSFMDADDRISVRGQPWICTIEDFQWPHEPESKSLISIALSMGVGVVSAHRAVNDCLLLVRMLERLGDAAPALLEDALARSLRPKSRFVSLAPFSEKDTVKAHGFHWDPDCREWWRVMAVEDAQRLPFRVREVAR